MPAREVGRGPTTSAEIPPPESWQLHAWDESGNRCRECGQAWPCDIARAITYGIGLGKMIERFGHAK